ncbi:hypothetical protein ACSVHC_08845 [Arthrobacter sp. KNU-44]|uniref:hypothetical protein n=1 Tax=Arthrobacter sp. KNU-44 TaxID=3450744 RepID=UPI003F44470E
MHPVVRFWAIKLLAQVSQDAGPENHFKTDLRVLPKRMSGFKCDALRIVTVSQSICRGDSEQVFVNFEYPMDYELEQGHSCLLSLGSTTYPANGTPKPGWVP